MATPSSYTIANFADQNPGEFGIAFYLNSGYTVQAINIDYDTCGGENVYQSLQQLEKITTAIDGTSYTFIITDTDDKGGYFHYRVQNQSIVNTVTTASIFNCIPAFLFPQAADSQGFYNGNYDITINNATEIRTNPFIYDIDRNKSQVKPVNYLSIVSGSATLAPVQESNYTSIGLKNSRYDGSETSITEYGIPASISARFFSADIYSLDIEDTIICSKSSDQRNLDDYYYVENEKYYPARWLPQTLGSYREATSLDKPAVRYIPAWNANLYNNLPMIGTAINTTQTLIQISGSRLNSIFEGDYLILAKLGSSEIVKVVSDPLPPTYNSATKVMSYFVERDALAPLGYSTGPFSVDNATKHTIHQIVGDVVYGADNNALYKVVDKKVYIEETKEIMIVDSRGVMIYKGETCTI